MQSLTDFRGGHVPRDISPKDHLSIRPALKGPNTSLCSLKEKWSAEVSDLINNDVVWSSPLFYQAAAVTNHDITPSVPKYCCKTVNLQAA